MPLMRIYHEHTYWGSAKRDDHVINVVQLQHVRRQHSGSAAWHDLRNQVRPQRSRWGFGSEATHLATVSTRREPKPATGGLCLRCLSVWLARPAGAQFLYRAQRLRPIITHCGGGDESFADRPRVVAGDIILVHAGIYQSFQDIYGRQSSTRPVEGTYYLFGQGTADKPIVIRAAGDGPVVFDGRGNFTLFNVCQGTGQIQLFRRHHLPQYGNRHPGGRCSTLLPAPSA